MIQNIENFGAELQADAFAQWKFTMQGKVDLPRCESAHNVAAKIALGPGRRSECCDIETLAAGIFGPIEIQRFARHHVRTNVKAAPDIQIRRKRGPCEKDAVRRPVAKQHGRDAVVR